MNKKQSIITIRQATEKDAESVATLFFNTIRAINSKDYNVPQIEAWSGQAPDPGMWKLRLMANLTFVACIGEEVAGFAGLEPDGHIDTFYVHHNYQGRGVASKLLKRIEAEGLKHGISRFYLEASITAKPFFQNKGFRVICPQEVFRRGQTFRNYKMEKEKQQI